VLEEIPDWAQRIAKAAAPGADPTVGSLRHLDPTARLRGIASVKTGEVIALGRPLIATAGQSHTGRPPFELEVEVLDNNALTVGTDRIRVDCHGLGVTHLDAINHFGVEGRWHGDVDARSAGPSVADWARLGIVTRGIFLDIPGSRGNDWVAVDQPVGAADFQRALAASGATIEPGDALIVYMGRERYEPSKGPLKPIAASPEGRPGIGKDGARWIAEQPVAAVLWDMLDAYSSDEEPFSVHLLIWAQGLALIDNCDLGALRKGLADRAEKTALVVVAPLNIPGATGSVVNPLLVV
jgi:kynurenine formamidase